MMISVEVIEKYHLTGRGLTLLVDVEKCNCQIKVGDYIYDGENTYCVKSFISPSKPSVKQYCGIAVDNVSIKDDNIFDI